MADDVGSQGQGATVNENENFDKKNYNTFQQNVKEQNLGSECLYSLLDTGENLSRNLKNECESKDNNLGPEDVIQPQVNTECNENNLAIASSVALNNAPIHGIKAKSNLTPTNVSLDNGKHNGCDKLESKSDESCVIVAVGDTSSNITGKNSCEEQVKTQVDPEGGHSTTGNSDSIQNTAASNNSETSDVDRVPEMLVEKVTKLNISPNKKSSAIKSEVVVNKQTESLKSLMVYNGDSDSESSDSEAPARDFSSEDEDNNTSTKKTWRKNVKHDSESSDSESDSSASTLSLESDSDTENSDDESASVVDVSDDSNRVADSLVLKKNNDTGAVKKKNINILDMEAYLPPIPDLSKLNINIDKTEFLHIGKVSAVISELVTVSANPGTPTFDLDSMLFIEQQTTKQPMGPIYDVIGPVAEPIYIVRFNNTDEVKDLAIKSGMKVYAVPNSEDFSKYVFVPDLMKIRGSDASWRNDQETPSDLAEFSDDEKERDARRAKKTNAKRKLEDGSLERHRRYERTMNQCNTLNTRVCRLMDAHKTLSKHIRPNERDDIKQPQDCPELDLPSIPPELLNFDPTIPPPGFGAPSPPPFYPYLNSSTTVFGQPPNFSNNPLPYPPNEGVGPWVPVSPFSNEPPPPQNLCPPPARWSWNRRHEGFRRPPRPNNPRANQQNNSDSYFSNNSRNLFGDAGPSSQPF